MNFDRRYRQAVHQVADFQKAYFTHRGEPAQEWAAETPFPWCDMLDEVEMAEFSRELFALVITAGKRRDLSEFENALRAWRSTVATYRAPDVFTAMLDPDEGEHVEVFSPEHYGYR